MKIYCTRNMGLCAKVELSKETLFAKEQSILDIWHLPFDQLSLEGEDRSILSETEQSKAEAFIKEEDRRRYVLSHIYLRKILTSYFPDVSEREWAFEINVYGKPALSGKQKKTFYFNLSHSRSSAYVICSNEAPCGIDVEDKREIEITKGMCELIFSKEELSKYNKLKNKEDIFYRYWTIKEAYLKALGSGLVEVELNTLNFESHIILSEDRNSFKIGRSHYWSESLDDQRFLAFCVLDSENELFPNYLNVLGL